MTDPEWIEGPDPEGSGTQVHLVYQGRAHPCCKCQACDELYRIAYERMLDAHAIEYGPYRPIPKGLTF